MIDALLRADEALFLLLNTSGIPLLDPFFLALSSKATNVVVYLSLSLYVSRTKDWKYFVSLAVVAALMITFTDQISTLFKLGLERLRPCYNPLLENAVRLVKESCGGKYGFFSAHASNSFALATFFGFLIRKNNFKRGSFLLFLLATLIALSRVYLGVHYPLDICCGALFGLFSGNLFWFVGKPFQLAYTK